MQLKTKIYREKEVIIMTIRQFAEVARQLIIILLISNLLLIAAVGYLLHDKIQREQEQLNKQIIIEELITIEELN